MVDWVEALGFLAAFFMFSTFYMKNMIPLRIIGMTSNATFIVYASLTQVWPLLVLHTVLLPMNLYRLIQMIRLIEKVRQASDGEMSFAFMIPHMKRERFKKGDIVFRQGDEADKIYLLEEGILVVDELEITLSAGELFGEMGVFSGERKRLATLRCKTDVELLFMTDNAIKQLYYQNPQFGFYLMQLLLKRLAENEKKSFQVATSSEEENLSPRPLIQPLTVPIND